jgi:hypothetical protein
VVSSPHGVGEALSQHFLISLIKSWIRVAAFTIVCVETQGIVSWAFGVLVAAEILGIVEEIFE